MGEPRLHLGSADYRKAQPRHRLSRSVPPGEEVELRLDFFLPEEYERQSWRINLVNEGLFWFSQRGVIRRDRSFALKST